MAELSKVGATLSKREIASKTSFARIYYWHWERQNFGVASNVRDEHKDAYETREGWIETPILSVKISKSVDRPSASFEISLMPTENWKQVLSPGDWIAIYLYSSSQSPVGTYHMPKQKNLVLFGNIDRVSRTLSKNEDTDKTELRYRVSGRNFGKVFEETDLWFDPYINQQQVLDVVVRTAGLEIIGSPTEQVEKVLKVFLGSGAQFDKQKTSPLDQWRMPLGCLELFGTPADGSVRRYFDSILNKEIEPDLPGFKVRGMLSLGDNANLWENLKNCSNDLVNSLIVDEYRDEAGNAKPTISLHPRPYNTPFFDVGKDKTSQFGKEKDKILPILNNKYQSLQDLGKNGIEISQSEIIYEDLGRDDHSRLNMFLLVSNNAMDYTKSIYSNLLTTKEGIGNPFFSRESITRHGLRRFQKLIEFDKPFKNLAAYSQIDLFKAFMVQTYDMNYANHLYDNGTIECTGVLHAQLGKALVVLPTKENGKKKVYYIEGYEHTWTFPGTWRTIFTVTHGQFFRPKDGNIFIDLSDRDFGSDDDELPPVYLAQTKVTKDG